MADESIIADLKSQGFDKLIQDLSLSAKGFTELDKSMAEAQKKLDTLDKSSQEFKDLTKEINAAAIASKAYAESNDTLKKELTDTNTEIGKLQRSLNALEKAGETNTQTYKDLVASQDALKKKSGELTNTVKDLNQEIKNSGSDTRNLDKAVRAISTVASGYQVAQGALALFGGENKKFEQTLLKLNAVMAITQGLQQIQEELSKRDSVFTALATKAKQAYTAATTTASGAVNGLRLAMLSLGAGAVIAVLALIAYNWDKITRAIGGADSRFQDYIDKYALLVKGSKAQLEAFDLEEKKLKLIGVSEEKILVLREEKIKQVIRGLRLQLAADEQSLRSAITSNAKLTALKNLNGGVGLVASLFLTTDSDLKELQEGNEKLKSEISSFEGQVLDIQLALKGKKETQKKQSNEKELQDNTRQSEKNLQITLEQLNEENRLYNKFRLERRKQEELSLKNQQTLEDERAKIILDTNQDNYTKRLEANQKLQDDLAEQNRQRQEDELQAEQEHIEKIGNLIGGLTDVANRIGNLASQAIEVRSQNEIRALDQRKQQGLISEKQYQKEMAKIKNEAARKQRTADIAMAFAMIPQAAFSAFTSTPGGIVVKSIAAALASAFGLAQVALIASAPLPQFRDGGQVSKKLGLIKGARHERGGVPIEVEGEEYVMPVEQTKENLPALEAMHKGTFHKLFIPVSTALQPDIFSNIPNPSNIALPVVNENNDYSSINKRLDKLASEMWWLGQYTKEGNKVRERGTEKIVKNLETQRKRYV